MGALTAHVNECMDYSADGEHLVTGGLDRLIKLWNPDSGKLERVFSGHPGMVMGVHFTLDQRRLISQARDGTVRIWDVANGKQLLSLTDPLLNGAYILRVGVSRDGRRVIAAPDHKPEILIWEAASAEQVTSWRQHEDADGALWAAQEQRRADGSNHSSFLPKRVTGEKPMQNGSKPIGNGRSASPAPQATFLGSTTDRVSS